MITKFHLLQLSCSGIPSKLACDRYKVGPMTTTLIQTTSHLEDSLMVCDKPGVLHGNTSQVVTEFCTLLVQLLVQPLSEKETSGSSCYKQMYRGSLEKCSSSQKYIQQNHGGT